MFRGDENAAFFAPPVETDVRRPDQLEFVSFDARFYAESRSYLFIVRDRGKGDRFRKRSTRERLRSIIAGTRR